MKIFRNILFISSFGASFYIGVYCLDIGVNTSTGTYEKGIFATFQKHFYGDYLCHPDINKQIYFSSSVMNKEFVDDTTSYYVDIEVIPGNTYYYYFGALYDRDILKDEPREIYISPDWYNEPSVTIWNNYFSSPPKVNFDTYTVVGTPPKVYLKWRTPKIPGTNVPLLDLFGGGYEIYRSTYDIGNFTNYTKVGDIVPGMDENIFIDQNILFGGTYYYLLRSYDAYTKCLYSMFSDTFTVVVSETRMPVKLVFYVDVNKVNNVKRVFISGNFLYPEWSFYELKEHSPGIYKFEYYNELTTLEGNKIEYKYYINEKIPEDIPNREVTIKISAIRNNIGVMYIEDIYSVKNIKKNFIPKELVSVSISTVTISTACIKIEFDPEEIGKIEKVILLSRVDEWIEYGQLASRTELMYTNTITTFVPIMASTQEHKLRIEYTDGLSIESSELQLNDSIPKKVFAGIIDTPVRYSPGLSTGSIRGKIVVPVPDKNYGQVTSYIIRISTFNILDLDTWSQQKAIRKILSYHPGVDQGLDFKFSYGECPGYYVLVGCVYGDNEAIGLSRGKVVVFPVVSNIDEDVVVKKGNYFLGDTTGSCKAELRIKKNSVKDNYKTYSCIIRNYYELLSDEIIRDKLEESWRKLQYDYRFKPIISNNPTEFNVKNTVFSFELYVGNERADYFTDYNHDSFADRVLLKESELVIPYFDTNNDGIIDGSEIKEDELVVCKLNLNKNFWFPVDAKKVEIDKKHKVVKFYTKEFSIYMLAGRGGWPEDLSKVAVYPNPFVGNDNEIENGELDTDSEEFSSLNFVNITENSKIYIFNLTMDIVFKEENVKQHSPNVGKYRWNLKNLDGEYVSSGMYYYLIKDDTLSRDRQRVAKGRITIVK